MIAVAFFFQSRRRTSKVGDELLRESFTFKAIVKEPVGVDAIPCLLFSKLNRTFFPSTKVTVTNLSYRGQAVLDDKMAMLRLAVGFNHVLEFCCETDSEVFASLKRCLSLIFMRTDQTGYGETYHECLQILGSCGHDPFLLIKTLEGAIEDGSRQPVLMIC